jgi:hypothetical protein
MDRRGRIRGLRFERSNFKPVILILSLLSIPVISDP